MQTFDLSSVQIGVLCPYGDGGRFRLRDGGSTGQFFLVCSADPSRHFKVLAEEVAVSIRAARQAPRSALLVFKPTGPGYAVAPGCDRVGTDRQCEICTDCDQG